MSEEDPLLRMTLGGKYHIDALIGRGGCGAVYRATQLPVERPVAIKVIRPFSQIELELVRQRFFVEAQVLGRLRDPSTVTLFDYGEERDGLLYMVQELVDGQTLGAVLRSEGSLAPDRAISIACQILHSLAEAHGFDIIHRDIKPTNIMVYEGRHGPNTAKLLDFGIAKILEAGQGEVTRPGTVVGTPIYLAPEQASERPVGPATDLYSLGVVLFHMVVGRPPFDGETAMDLLMQHVHSPPPPLPDWVPVRLAAAIGKALSKAPNERFASARDMRLALEASLNGEPASVPPMGSRPTRPYVAPIIIPPRSEIPPHGGRPGPARDEPSESTQAPETEPDPSWLSVPSPNTSGPGALGASHRINRALSVFLLLVLVMAGAAAVVVGILRSSPGGVDAGGGGGVIDSGADRSTPDADSGPVDSGPVDSDPVDSDPVDSGPVDSGPVDAALQPPEHVLVERRIKRALKKCDCNGAERHLRRMAEIHKWKYTHYNREKRKACVMLGGACTY